MSKILSLILVLGITSSIYAQGVLSAFRSQTVVPSAVPTATATISVGDAFKKFQTLHDLREIVSAAHDYRQAVRYTVQMLELTITMERKDIQAWQLNNMGWYIISEFKLATKYTASIEQLKLLAPADKKIAVAALQERCRAQLSSLLLAKTYLTDAWELNQSLYPTAVNKKDLKEQTRAIESNLRFIDWVTNFVQK